MMSNIERAMLRCSTCGKVTEHRVRYAGRLIADITCSCGALTSRDPAEAWAEYVRDLEQRLRSKPGRLLRRAADDPVRFLTDLPGKLVAQPFKLAREWRALQHIDPSRPRFTRLR